MTRNQEIAAEVDSLIAERDAGRAGAQDQIDALMTELETIVAADSGFQRRQADAAWGRACTNNALWN